MQPALTTGEPGLPKQNRRHLLLVGGILLLVVLCLAIPAVANPVRAVWSVANVLLYFFLVGWGLVHPRAVAPAFAAARVWGFWMALASTLLGYSSLEIFLAEALGLKIPGGLMLFGSLGFFLVLLPFLVFNGLVGAAAGAFFGAGASPEARARTGATMWWLVSLAAFLGLAVLPEANVPALLLSAPVLTAAACRGLARRGLEPRTLGDALLRFLSRRLIWRRTREGRPVQVDFRGPALGLAAATLALMVGATGVLIPVQSLVLVSQIRLRNEPLFNGAVSLYQMRHPEAREGRRGIVMLRMDPSVRRKILTSSSEPAVQAEAIRRLKQWGARLIVLPAPILDDEEVEPAILHTPRPGPDDAERAALDLPRLTRVVRETPNVVLSIPSEPGAYTSEAWGDIRLGDQQVGLDNRLQHLASLTRHTGQAGVAFLGAARLPAIPTQWRERPPLPVVVAAAAAGKPVQVERLRGGGGVRVAGRLLPEIAPHRLLVEFIGTAPGQDFPTVPYGGLLSGEAIYDTEQDPHQALMTGPEGEWVAPARYFQGKIVFLDSIAQPLRDTPLGVMPLAEVQANAAATLMSDSPIRSLHPAWTSVGVVALAVFVGWLCRGRRPLDAVWRAIAVVMAVSVMAAGLFLAWGLWLDPVVPQIAVVGAFLLVTQLTFEVERSERERNRALLQRFVAPQLVDQMLADPDFDPNAGGQRRQVCVVFADVRNFTGFAEQHSPEEVIEITNRYLGAMTDAIHAYGGILDKYTGDGLMAFFLETLSAPGQEESLNVRAVQAAVMMQRGVAHVSSQLQREGREALQVGIGLHYGEAVVGFVGNANRLDYTALGHTVVVSQRLQSIAGGGEVVISETVFRTVSGRFPVEAGEPVQVKGLSQPVTPYRVAPWL